MDSLLPQEILELVIDALHGYLRDENRAIDLRQYMGVCKAFYYPCRERVFAKTICPLHFDDGSTNRHIDSLCRVLEQNTSLLLAIREFELCFERRVHPMHYWGELETSGINIEQLQRLSVVLSRSAIHTLMIKHEDPYSSGSFPLTNDFLGDTIQSAIIGLRCCIPSLRQLTLSNFEYPPRALIMGDPRTNVLERLILEEITLESEPYPSHPDRLWGAESFFSKLKTLKLNSSAGLSARSLLLLGFNWERFIGIDRIEFENLEELSLGQVEATQGFLEVAREGVLSFPKLQRLMLIHPESRYSSIPPGGVLSKANAPFYTGIRKLSITFDVRPGDTGFLDMLQKITLPKSLECLQVIFHYYVLGGSNPTFGGAALGFLHLDWSAVDKALSRGMAGCSVATFQLRIRLKASPMKISDCAIGKELGVGEGKRFDRAVHAAFPAMQKSGRFLFSWKNVDVV